MQKIARNAFVLIGFLLVAGCAIGLKDLRSGEYRGTVARKFTTTGDMTKGTWQIHEEVHYYIEVEDDRGGTYRLTVDQEAFNSVEKGTRLPLGGGKR